MADIYATIADTDRTTQERLAAILELRAADPGQRAILDGYISEIEFGSPTRVLDVGCGTGFVARVVAPLPGVVKVVGVDLSSVFIARARELSAAFDSVFFEVADARALPFSEGNFDVVIFHTTLTHVPQPERALAEAFRVLRPGGRVAVCDGDYSTISVANGEWDPLQTCIEAVKAAYINDLWLIRRLPALMRSAGFHSPTMRSRGYLRIEQSDYMTSLVDRGADTLAASTRIGPELCAGLKAELQRRVQAGEFFAFIGFASCIASKAGTETAVEPL